MSIEDRLRGIVTALPEEASVTLPVVVVKEWLEVEADDPLADLTVADVAEQLGRSPGTVRDWIPGPVVHGLHTFPSTKGSGVPIGRGGQSTSSIQVVLSAHPPRSMPGTGAARRERQRSGLRGP